MNIEKHSPLKILEIVDPEALKILASTASHPKLIEELASDLGTSLVDCRKKVDEMISSGLLVVDHDSDLYGHELLKIRNASKQFSLA